MMDVQHNGYTISAARDRALGGYSVIAWSIWDGTCEVDSGVEETAEPLPEFVTGLRQRLDDEAAERTESDG